MLGNFGNLEAAGFLPIGMLRNMCKKFVGNSAAIIRLVPSSSVPYSRSYIEEPLRQASIQFHQRNVAFAKFDSPFSCAQSRGPLDEVAITICHPDKNAQIVVVIIRPKDCVRRSFHAEPLPSWLHPSYCEDFGKDAF